jgi:transketolase
VALKTGKGFYPWHAGAPDDQSFQDGYQEIIERINGELRRQDLAPLALKAVEPEAKPTSSAQSLEGEQLSFIQTAKFSKVSDEYVVNAYGEALLEIAAQRPDLVVLDADLAADCRVRKFELTYPDRFIENGIAEQDMVSMAGGLARQGLLPVVNSFANFLASRANEQIYNNASEGSKVIYACHYAGLIPAGPGKSHQSIRDISLFGALPNCLLLQPCNAVETRQAVAYCVNEAQENCVLRLIIGPSPRIIQLPAGYALELGKGAVLREGSDAVLFGYGPVMLHEALLASELLEQKGFGLKVVNMPWLNRIDPDWLVEMAGAFQRLFVLEDHAPVGGLGDRLLEVLAQTGLIQGRSLTRFAVEGYPAFGTPGQALQYHGLDGASLAGRIFPKMAMEQ